MIPLDQGPDSNVFCCAALVDATQGTLYTDVTGSLSVQPLEGMQAFFVAYDYDTNTIFALPIKDLKDETIVQAFEQAFTELEDKGYKPKLNVTDNQFTKLIKELSERKDCKWQFVEPLNHRVNAAEKAIRTVKNNFIAGLASTDSH